MMTLFVQQKRSKSHQVEKIVRHPQFDAKRLSDDIAVMITSRVIGEAFPYSADADDALMLVMH